MAMAGTGKGMVSSEVNIEGWVTIFDPLTAENISFNLEFAVPKAFGVPGAIVVRNNHPNEFLLLSFELELHDKSKHQYYTNSWIYNTEHEATGRIFFHNKVGIICAAKSCFCKFNKKPRGHSHFHGLSRLE